MMRERKSESTNKTKSCRNPSAPPTTAIKEEFSPLPIGPLFSPRGFLSLRAQAVTPLARHYARFARHGVKPAARLVHVPKPPRRFRLRTPPAVVAPIAAPPLELLPRLYQLVRAPFSCRHCQSTIVPGGSATSVNGFPLAPTIPETPREPRACHFLSKATPSRAAASPAAPYSNTLPTFTRHPFR